ncbi:MAG: PorT family protein [Bacteroidetes bacterium]|nr:PorT family protein [Bacteroidota bacterium]
MKIVPLLSFVFLFSTTVHSQVQTGLFAGPQLTTADYSVQGDRQNTSNKYGFQLGMNFKVPFDNNLFFAPQVFYSLKGYKSTFTQHVYPPDATATDNNTTIHTLELAALLQVDFSKNPQHWFLRIGPTLDFQLFGHEKFHLLNSDYISRSMKYGFNEYGRYAANAMVQFGYESATGFSIYLNYGYGLTNINNVDDGPNIRHRVVGISFGKYFRNNKIVSDTRNKQ